MGPLRLQPACLNGCGGLPKAIGAAGLLQRGGDEVEIKAVTREDFLVLCDAGTLQRGGGEVEIGTVVGEISWCPVTPAWWLWSGKIKSVIGKINFY